MSENQQAAVAERSPVKQIVKFQNSKGDQFDTEGEAIDSEYLIANAVRINSFIDKHYPSALEGKRNGPSRSIAKKAIEKFLSERA